MPVQDAGHAHGLGPFDVRRDVIHEHAHLRFEPEPVRRKQVYPRFGLAATLFV
jgi:hypothetical protein